MIKATLMAASLAATALFASAPAIAQDYPMVPGTMMEVSEVHLEDGGGYDYAEFLAKQWRTNQEFAKSKGWITDYKVYTNVFARDGEPDLFLVVYYPSIPDAAEAERRRVAFNAFMKQSDAQLVAASGDRAKMRHLGSTLLLQEMRFK